MLFVFVHDLLFNRGRRLSQHADFNRILADNARGVGLRSDAVTTTAVLPVHLDAFVVPR